MHKRNVYVSVLVFFGGLALLFFGVCALLYFRQDTFIFFPKPNDAGFREAWQKERVEIRSGDEVLEGWWLDNPQSTTGKVVIYFGGNAEDVLYTAGTMHLDARRILFVNYRGYGGSTGKPSEKGFFEDALTLYGYATRKERVRPEDVVLMGRSLGSGVATMLASDRPVAGVVLITPFDSLVSVAAEHYPFTPVRFLLKHRFESIERAPLLEVPVLVLAAQHDNIVPPAHAQRLFDAWGGKKKEILILEGVGHNDIQEHLGYYEAINEFLRSL
jgi:pimeloyl-ACP methyl ester carboxylesterase